MRTKILMAMALLTASNGAEAIDRDVLNWKIDYGDQLYRYKNRMNVNGPEIVRSIDEFRQGERYREGEYHTTYTFSGARRIKDAILAAQVPDLLDETRVSLDEMSISLEFFIKRTNIDRYLGEQELFEHQIDAIIGDCVYKFHDCPYDYEIHGKGNGNTWNALHKKIKGNNDIWRELQEIIRTAVKSVAEKKDFPWVRTDNTINGFSNTRPLTFGSEELLWQNIRAADPRFDNDFLMTTNLDRELGRGMHMEYAIDGLVKNALAHYARVKFSLPGDFADFKFLTPAAYRFIADKTPILRAALLKSVVKKGPFSWAWFHNRLPYEGAEAALKEYKQQILEQEEKETE